MYHTVQYIHIIQYDIPIQYHTYSMFTVALLYHMIQKPGWVFTRDQLIDAVKGENYIVTDRSIDVIIVGLRKKLGEGTKYIETVRGMGYRFCEDI